MTLPTFPSSSTIEPSLDILQTQSLCPLQIRSRAIKRRRQQEEANEEEARQEEAPEDEFEGFPEEEFLEEEAPEGRVIDQEPTEDEDDDADIPVPQRNKRKLAGQDANLPEEPRTIRELDLPHPKFAFILAEG